jgi:hypothetical protein
LTWVAIVLSLVLVVEALNSGLLADDYIQRFKLLGGEGLPANYADLGGLFGGSPLLNLFRFFPGSDGGNEELVRMGVLPWWSTPDAKGAFFRPLTAATHMLDYRLFPDGFLLQHLHNFLWAGLGVLVVSKLYRQHFKSAGLAGIAILAFALEDAHAIPTGWLANRNAWIALVFGGLCILRHTRDNARGPDWLAGACFAMGLLGGEMGLCAMAYVGAWELVVQKDRIASRIRRLVPYALVFVIWALAYRALGFGAYGSGLYTDPLREPGVYLAALPGKFGILAAGQVLQAPSDVWVGLGSQMGWWIGSACCVLLLVGLLLSRSWFRAKAIRQFWLLGALFSLLPVCGSFPMDRLLIYSGIGFFGLLAEAAGSLGLWVSADNKPQEARGTRRFVGVLLILHIPLAALMLPFKINFSVDSFQSIADFSLAEDGRQDADEHILIVVNSVDLLHAYLPLVRAHYGRKVHQKCYQLANLSTDLELERVSTSSIRIRHPHGFLLNEIDQITRGRQHEFQVGETRNTGLFQATVESLNEDGRPVAVRFDFPGGADDPRLVWTAFDHGILGPLDLPEVGQSIQLARPKLGDLLGMMRDPDAYIHFPSAP